MSGGLALSRRYWQQCGLPGLQANFPALLPQLAAGLVGEGSECLGYDDALSRDHDWGPGFCLWLPRPLYAQHAAALQTWYDGLPAVFEGFEKKRTPGRVGVMETEEFFTRFIGAFPRQPLDWLRIPEQALSVCVNGEVFYDPTGEFIARQNALRTPPAAVRQKKLAARCVTMMQAGQYNLPRCRQRGEALAAALAAQEFARAAAGAACLLGGRWPPFYKWLPRTLRALPAPGPALAQTLQELLLPEAQFPGLDPAPAQVQDALIHNACLLIADELRRQGLTALPGCDMQQLGLDIQRQISDETLRALPVLLG